MQRLLGKRAGLQTSWFQACLNSELGLTVEAASFLSKGLSRLRKQTSERFKVSPAKDCQDFASNPQT